tara:strand:- start:524 stop:781 length:258 start_codon:yes stop_codon:yes gene_type:complete
MKLDNVLAVCYTGFIKSEIPYLIEKLMKHLIQTIKLIGTEIRVLVKKVLDFLASPYWKLYNELLNRDFRRNPEKYSHPDAPPEFV